MRQAVTWDGLLEYLGLLGAVVERHPEVALVAWPPGSRAAARPIVLELAAHFDEPWLVATVPLCPARDVDPRRALELNAVLPMGEVATAGDLCIVRTAAPLARLSWEDVERTLAMLAWTPAAAVLAPRSGERDDGVFAQWA